MDTQKMRLVLQTLLLKEGLNGVVSFAVIGQKFGSFMAIG